MKSRDQQIRRRHIRSERDVMNVARFHQRRNVGFVRVRRERVAQKNHRRDLLSHDQRAKCKSLPSGPDSIF